MTSPPSPPPPADSLADDLVGVVLAEALGASVTPFVPVPWVDDWMHARLLRRIARKVLTRRGLVEPRATAKAIVDAYVHAGESPVATRALIAAARFVVRKVAVVLDVKKSHDVFGEALAFAIAVDIVADAGWTHGPRARDPRAIGETLHHATRAVGSGALDTLTRAVRSSFSAAAPGAPAESRFARVASSVGTQLDTARAHLASVLLSS
jgi:hypothetical protein